MDRKARNDLLERLVSYRRAYAVRGSYDSEPVLTVEEAIAFGERLMRSAREIEATVHVR